MRFADEVVPPAELDDVLPSEKPKVAKREVQMAEQLIDSLTRSFDPTAYRDEYREELLAMIERKAAGEEIVAAPEGDEREATKAPDLMAALEESIAAVQGRTKKRKPQAKKKRSTSTAKSAPKSRSR
jgi:DNA end-binding protein Ku